MTVIVWDGKTLAADRQSGTDYIKCFSATKISVIRGHLVGLAGNASINMMWRAWFERGADPVEFISPLCDEQNYAHALVITPDAEILAFQRTPYPFKLHGPRHAIGSGAEAALAVMECGHGAVHAVEIASRICAGVGGGIDALSLAALHPGKPPAHPSP